MTPTARSSGCHEREQRPGRRPHCSQDIQTRIKELRRSDDNLEQYVNVEPVKTMSGSRVIEKEADTTAWPEIDENGEFTEVETPQFAKIAYKITKRAAKCCVLWSCWPTPPRTSWRT